MKKFAIMDGELFLQRVEPNENYIPVGRAIQTDLHQFNEYRTVFGKEEKWFDPRTLRGYIDILIDEERWSGNDHKEYVLICKEK